jgi:hypothetical protein
MFLLKIVFPKMTEGCVPENKVAAHSLEECLDMEQGKLLPVVHPYGEYYENVYHDLKKHALEFTMEQLSQDTLFQYLPTIPHPGKFCGKMFEFVPLLE